MENRDGGSQALTPPNRGGGRTTATKAASGAASAAAAAASRGGGGAPSFITPPNITGSASATAAAAFNEFADFAAFDDQEEENAIVKKDASSLTPARTAAASKRVTQSQTQTQSQSPMPSSSNGAGAGGSDDPQQVFRKPLSPKDKTVNPAGTHWHNHFKFLHPAHRKDANGRPTSHPDHDPHTLRVDKEEIRRVRGSKLTPAQEQWWDIKACYADALLLFKTGKFYEIFHQDADVAVQVLDFVYMKGCDAHAGFPEISYGQFCDRLVRAGHKVARVEQTETPEMLKERKSQARKGQKKPMVVNREVCSVTTAGTRTFCFMDDSSALATEGGMGEGATGGIGPLIVIKETLVGSNTTSDDDDADGDDGSVKPVCEYGVAIVDAVRGAVTLGQFADDVLRSRMLTLLTNFAPSEVRTACT